MAQPPEAAAIAARDRRRREADNAWVEEAAAAQAAVEVEAEAAPKLDRLVVLASPFAGDVDLHVRYARAAMVDSLERAEAPLAPHLLYPQVLDDADPKGRAIGTAAGLAWIARPPDALVVYVDLGISPGMRAEIDLALAKGIPVEPRSIEGWATLLRPAVAR